MLSNYFNVAIRNILRNRIYSAINIFGLATAITLCLLIILFIIDQGSMDNHMPDQENAYRVLTGIYDKERDAVRHYATSPYETTERLELNHPEILETTRLIQENNEIRFGDRIFDFKGLYAESNFLNFFNFDLVDSKAGALVNPNSVVLRKELGEKLFLDENPIGKQIEIKGLGSFLVTGVIDELIGRSHIEFDVIISFSSFNQRDDAINLQKDWIEGANRFRNYIKAKSDDLPAIERTLSDFVKLLPPENQADYSFGIQSLADVSMGEPVRNEIGFVTPFFVPWFLGILAAIVMLSATFNYVGLAIALAIKRAKEVGIRKIVGATKRQVFIQFLVEAQVTVLFSWVLSLALLSFLIPAYNDLKVLRDINGDIRIDMMANFHIYLIFLVFAIFIGFIAGGYPAWYVGKMSFSKALGRKESSARSSFLIRKSLIFLQYTSSIVFIVTAIVLQRQATHFFQMDYGFDQSNLINVPLKDMPYDAFKSELMRDSKISGVSVTNIFPGLDIAPKIDVYKQGGLEPVAMSKFSVNEDFLKNFGIELIEGRNFDSVIKSDSLGLLINAQAAGVLKIEPSSPNALIRLSKDGPSQRVIGVIDDFKYNLLFRDSGPLILTYANEGSRFVNIRYKELDEAEAALSIEGIWRQFDKLHPFEYTHFEFELNDMYNEFLDITRIVGVVSALAILIACLGQFGMILHHVQLKVKEVGIRKTLGANLRQLIYLLSRGYLTLIVLSAIIGTPIAWWINQEWTNRVAYSVTVNWWTLVLGLILVFGLAIISIVGLTWKTANNNPVDSLRYE